MYNTWIAPFTVPDLFNFFDADLGGGFKGFLSLHGDMIQID